MKLRYLLILVAFIFLLEKTQHFLSPLVYENLGMVASVLILMWFGVTAGKIINKLLKWIEENERAN